MSDKIRIGSFVDGYYFPDYPALAFHSGLFWINGKEAKKVYNNGSISINYLGRKISLNKLRKSAVVISFEIIDMPF